MGRKAQEAKIQRRLKEDEAKPWHERHFRPLVSAAALGVLASGLPLYRWQDRVQTERRAEAAERADYGNLYEYRDQITQAMVSPEQNGRRDYEDFLPKLSRTASKFDVKVYLGAPPEGTKLQLYELPEDIKKIAMAGLKKWDRYFNFTITTDITEADIKVFAEGNVLQILQQGGRALMPSAWANHELWNEYIADREVLGHVVLLNQNYLAHGRINPAYSKFVTAHEFGHFSGLEHPDSAFYFGIKKLEGVSDPSIVDGDRIGRILKEQALLYPQFSDLSVMLAGGSLNMEERYLGDLDHRAMEIILELYDEKYSQQGAGRQEHTPSQSR